MQTHLSRRQFLRTAAYGLGAAALCGSRLATGSSTDAKRPNIILLVTDDQRADAMGCRNPLVRTPNMDALAADGVLFTNAFVTTSICCTSRASIFTGQHAARHGIYNFSTHFTPEAFAQTYPARLKDAGYRLGFIGKYGVGPKRDLPVDFFDYWRGFPGQGHYEKNKDENGDQIHLTRLMGNQAVEFLNGCREDQPFCLSVSFKAPHCQDGDPRQFLYDPAFEHLYQDVTIPPPPVSEDKYWQQQPEFFRKNNEGRKRWDIRFSTPEKYQNMVKAYYRLIYGVDVVIGRIRKQLEQQGLAENTVILMIGDNGFFLGEHGLAGKWYPYEESIRVPLIVYDPRADRGRRGTRCPQWALNIDIAPTILSLAGAAIPNTIQGRDLTPLLQGRDVPWRQDFYYDHRLGIPTIPPCEALVTPRYKYILYSKAEPLYEELYDLQTDPHEIHNLAADPAHQGTLERLRKRFNRRKEHAR